MKNYLITHHCRLLGLDEKRKYDEKRIKLAVKNKVDHIHQFGLPISEQKVIYDAYASVLYGSITTTFDHERLLDLPVDVEWSTQLVDDALDRKLHALDTFRLPMAEKQVLRDAYITAHQRLTTMDLFAPLFKVLNSRSEHHLRYIQDGKPTLTDDRYYKDGKEVSRQKYTESKK